MLTFAGFSGINNVQPTERLLPAPKTNIAPLVAAMNVDIGLTNEVRRRRGFASLSSDCHKNLWQSPAGLLATVEGDLINVDTTTVLFASFGMDRTWYLNLPDGRTVFSNGLISGITDGATVSMWGVPVPNTVGTANDMPGALKAGRYRWQATNVRTSDGLESGPVYSGIIDIALGGIALDGLEQIDGHSVNIYITSHNDDIAYKAGNTTGATFNFAGANDTLTLPCKTDFCIPPPAGILLAFWNGRVLLAVDNMLFATRSQQWELLDPRKDMKQFGADITLVQPVADGIWVGTTQELVFLAGSQFDALTYRLAVPGPVVLGSGVTVDAGNLPGQAQGDAMVCIAGGGYLYAGFAGGTAVNLTDGRYATDTTEVAAVFRMERGTPQYIAIPQ